MLKAYSKAVYSLCQGAMQQKWPHLAYKPYARSHSHYLYLDGHSIIHIISDSEHVQIAYRRCDDTYHSFYSSNNVLPMSNIHLRWLYTSRFAEVVVTLTTWIIVTLPLWLSPFHPAVVAYGIIAFNLYFLYQSIDTGIQAVKAYLLIKEHDLIAYPQKLTSDPSLSLSAQAIRHFVIVPCYKESIEKIQETLTNITLSDYPFLSNITVVLGLESREPEAREKARLLSTQFAGSLDIIATYHTLTMDEVPGKASNQTWAVKEIVRTHINPQKTTPENTLITICDADSKFPKNFFSYLTYTYLADPDRRFHFYWAPVLLYNNFWKLPFFVRMQASLSSIVRLAYLQDKENLIQISTYAVSLSLLQDIGYWDVDIIPEDWHVHLQAFFTHGKRVKTIPLYTIVNGDAVYSGSLRSTFLNRYEQEKRWAWGVSDVAYAWKRMWETPHIGIFVKLKKFTFLLRSHLLWPTSFFILTLFATITPMVNPVFKRTVMGFILPQVSGIILTVSSAMLIVYTVLDILVRKKLAVETRPQNFILLVLQWYILPIVSFFLSSIPALDAHTRMLMGKKIVYKVTEKS